MWQAALTTPVLWAFAALALGIAAGEWLGSGPAALVLVAALALLAVAWRRGRGVFVAALLAWAALGSFRGAVDTPPPPASTPCAERSLWRVAVHELRGRTFDPRDGTLLRRAYVELLAERCGEAFTPRRGLVGVELAGAPLARGDVLDVSLAVSPRRPFARNPTDVDPEFMARRDGTAGYATALGPPVHVSFGTGMSAWIDRARERVAEAFEARFPGEGATLAKALSMGDQSAVGPEMRERWSDSGLTHLLSVSGLHLSLVAALVYFLLYHWLAFLPAAGERWSLRRVAALATLPAVVAFCVWAGSPAPAVRATVMAGAALLGVASGRPSAATNAVGIAGVGILLHAPVTLYDPGFLLSFVGVLALLFMPALPKAASRWRRLANLGLGLLLASLLATAVSAPITAYYFGRGSFIGVFTNIVGVPLGSGIATPLALVHSLVAPWSRELAELVAWPLDWTLRALSQIVAVSAHLPLAGLDLPRPRPLELVAYFVGLGAFVWGGPRRRVWVVVCAVVLVGCGVQRWWSARFSGELRLTHVYVGQGDATLVRFPEGGVMLVDAGGVVSGASWDPGRQALAPLLRQRGIRRIDIAVVSHPHPDHLEGFAYLATHFPIGELWWNGSGAELPTLRLLHDAVRAAGGQVRLAHELPSSVQWSGAQVDVLHPRPEASVGEPYYPELSENDNSVALRLLHGKRSVFLAGDLEAQAESLLTPKLVPTDVLKSPHHGSRTSSTAGFLEALKPRLVVISCGENNRFGFPHDDVMARYATVGASVLRTDRDGFVELATDGHSWRANTASGRLVELWPAGD